MARPFQIRRPNDPSLRLKSDRLLGYTLMPGGAPAGHYVDALCTRLFAAISLVPTPSPVALSPSVPLYADPLPAC